MCNFSVKHRLDLRITNLPSQKAASKWQKYNSTCISVERNWSTCIGISETVGATERMKWKQSCVLWSSLLRCWRFWVSPLNFRDIQDETEKIFVFFTYICFNAIIDFQKYTILGWLGNPYRYFDCLHLPDDFLQ